LPRSGNAALAAGALVQAALGAVFLLAGLSKVVAPTYTQLFRDFVQGSAGATDGPLAPLIQALVVPNLDVMAELARFTELFAGAVLLVGSLEVARRRFAGPLGAQHGYEPLVALASAGAAFVLGGLSLGIYLLQGGRVPSVNPDLAFASPIAIELLMVPLAVGIAWLELGRFLALRSTPPGGAQV
jgi:Ca2+/H+ antiporter